MHRSSSLTCTLALFAGMVATVLLLEGVLRILPVYGGANAADPRASWPLHTLIPGSQYTYSIGWNFQNIHHGRINNLGYVAPGDYRAGASGIVVVGDSFIESLMNEYRDTLQGSLNDYLRTPSNVMSFGTSGADMPHYLGIARAIGERFAPKWAVVVINGTDFTGGFSAESGYYRWAPERDPPIRLVPEVLRSGFEKWARTVALVRYLRGNLLLRPSQLIRFHRGADPAGYGCEAAALSERDGLLLEAFTRELPSVLQVPAANVILVLDSDRRAIYAHQTSVSSCLSRGQLARQRLIELAQPSGMRVIDSDPVFRKYYEAEHRPLDHSPLDPHWNATAHRLMAREVAAVINGSNERPSP
jgi:hypothetical protein